MGVNDDRPGATQDKGQAKAGTQLSGIYELDERIAFGGMGEVWRGHNIHTGDDVAIKIVLPELARDQAILSLFRKEASILNHLSHDAVVRYHVFTVAPNIGRPYLAMEFVGGESLLDIMRRGPMPVEDVRRLCHRLALGLHAVHEAGAVHRDLSPDNIILPQGRVEKAKIIDFGIARSPQMGETLIGDKFAGKYNYVSPEQLGLYGGEVGRQSDIYSLGLILAGALRGRPLDMNGSHLEIVEKRRTVPDLSGTDENFRPILTAMLQPQPRDRPASMAVVASLTQSDQREGSGTYPPGYARPAASAPWESATVAGRPASTPPSTRSQDAGFVAHETPVHIVQGGAGSSAPRAAAAAPRPLMSVTAVAIASAAVLAVIAGGGLYLSGGLSSPTTAEAPPPVALTASNEAPAAVATQPEPVAAAPAQPEAVSPAQVLPETVAAAPAQPETVPSPDTPQVQTAPVASPALEAPQAQAVPAPASPLSVAQPTVAVEPAVVARPVAQQSAPAPTSPVEAVPAANPPPAPAAVAENHAVDASSTSASTAAPDAGLLAQLAAVGIDYSVAESDIRDWIVNIYTPYPAFAGALLNLLKDRGLRKPVYIDVIAGNYESASGGSSPGSVEEVDVEKLKEAVLKGYNVRHGEKAKAFEDILR